jgi:hypothetical protein
LDGNWTGPTSIGNDQARANQQPRGVDVDFAGILHGVLAQLYPLGVDLGRDRRPPGRVKTSARWADLKLNWADVGGHFLQIFTGRLPIRLLEWFG